MAERSSVIWKALVTADYGLLKSLDLTGFDWHAKHAHFGTPLHALLLGGLYFEGIRYGGSLVQSAEGPEPRLAALELIMRYGADPWLASDPTWQRKLGWDFGEISTSDVHCGGKTVVECLLDVKSVLREYNETGVWTTQISVVSKALEIMAKHKANSYKRDRVSVPEGLLSTWEAALMNASAADVSICAQNEVVVPAHSLVLSAASKVLAAMLQSTWKEGSERWIRVEDCDGQSIRLLLSLLYTGSVPEEVGLELETLMSSLALAHRWEIDYVVESLSSALSEKIDMKSVESIADFALRLHLESLLVPCRSFMVEAKDKLGKKLKAPAVKAEFIRITKQMEADPEAPARKKRRVL